MAVVGCVFVLAGNFNPDLDPDPDPDPDLDLDLNSELAEAATAAGFCDSGTSELAALALALAKDIT